MILLITVDDKRPHKTVPRGQNIHDGDDRKTRQLERQNHIPVEMQVTGTVHTRGIEKIF